jgi:hypothetical protein
MHLKVQGKLGLKIIDLKQKNVTQGVKKGSEKSQKSFIISMTPYIRK